MIIKTAQAYIRPQDVRHSAMDQDDPEILAMFHKTAADLKAIAPKAKDFLYFTCIMMHAAEAALINDDGSLKKTAKGEDVKAWWEEKGDALIWRCNDPNILPYKNANGDLFPSLELKKAYKNWVGKPLCVDHESSKAEKIRGVIVDTVYDDKTHKVIALCALDKVNYPELARNIATGVSADVSMGVSVGRAICFDCHTVARTEADFCQHMRAKSAYGEVNCDLNPIELSIVSNGADRKAKIRRVIAAANSIAQYIEMKKVAGLTSEDFSNLTSKVQNVQSEIDEIKNSLEEMAKSVNKDESTVDANNAEAPYRVSKAMQESEPELTTSIQMPSTDRFASETMKAIKGLEEKIEGFNSIINKMASIKETPNSSEETNMTNTKQAYFQGGGGVNEPTPKQVKYPPEDYKKVRDTQDKQMVGAKPFPEVGPVDGLYPGVGENDLELKKKILRAKNEQEARKLRRLAALEKAKKAYHLGGGEGNDPENLPYEEMGDYQKIRDTQDKQMVGAKPFPGVGPVDGLYGDDKKKKEMLLRAKLVGKFVKASDATGQDDKANSRWDIYAKTDDGSKLVLSASVAEIAGSTVKVDALYDSIATKEYGSKMISTIRQAGLDKAAAMFKSAQEMPALPGAPAAPAAAPAAPTAAAPAPEAPAEEAEYAGEEGTPVEKVEGLTGELANLVPELQKAVDALQEEAAGGLADLDVLEPAAPAAPAAAPVVASVSLPQMRKTLNRALQKEAVQSIKELREAYSELKLIARVHADSSTFKKADSGLAKQIVADAVVDAKKALANAHMTMAAFVKYAKGTEVLTKKAAMIKKAQNVTEFDPATGEKKAPRPLQGAPDPSPKPAGDLGRQPANRPNVPVTVGEPAVDTAKDDDKEAEKAWIEKARKAAKDAMEGKDPSDPGMGALEELLEEDVAQADSCDSNPADVTVHVDDAKIQKAVEDGLNKPASLDALRLKIAQKGLQFSEMLQKAHPQGGTKTKLDVKPAADGDKVETLTEVHTKMVDVALAPPKVRKDAEAIQKLVLAGEIDPKTDFPGLVAKGLDSAAVSYWKKFYGEGDGESKSFAGELTKAYKEKKAAEEQEIYRVKVARAYELTYDMVNRGMLSGTKEAIAEQVSSLMKCSDEQFGNFKGMVSKYNMKKSASIPEVGKQESILATQLVQAPEVTGSERDLFEAAFRNRKY